MNFNSLKTAFLLAILTMLFVAIGGLIGGKTGVVIAFGLAFAMNFFSYWFSDKIILKMYRAHEVTEAQYPKLHAMVRRLATKAQVPMPKVYVIENPTPNAFATGRNPQHAAVAATTGIMSLLTDEELEGVMAHEMAHVIGRDILIGTIAATFAGAVMMLADMARWAFIFGGMNNRDDEEGGNAGAIVGLVLSIIAPIAAMLIQMAVSRSREYLADERGAKLCGNPEALASALHKISYGVERIPMEASPATAHMFIMSPLSAQGVFNLFSTHPPVDERIKRLRAMTGVYAR